VWKNDAACKAEDLEKFFATTNACDTYRDAKKICATCPVQAECLDYAVYHGIDYGLWGGMSPKQRRVWKRFMYPKNERKDYVERGLDYWIFDGRPNVGDVVVEDSLSEGSDSVCCLVCSDYYCLCGLEVPADYLEGTD
jgi:WhiB family redox-sensing transcriptional regulator